MISCTKVALLCHNTNLSGSRLCHLGTVEGYFQYYHTVIGIYYECNENKSTVEILSSIYVIKHQYYCMQLKINKM